MTTLALDIRLLFAAPGLTLALSPEHREQQDRRSDMDLLDRARRGDPSALQDLYQRHADMVYRRLTHLVGPDPEREDLLQEVFLALFQRLDAFRGEARLTTYLQRIATNKAYDHLRRRSRLNRTEARDQQGADSPCHTPSPEGFALGDEKVALLARCLDKLKPNKRIAFVLRVVEGLTLKEISGQVDASVQTVAQRIRHARMELTEMVRQYEDKEDGR